MIPARKGIILGTLGLLLVTAVPAHALKVATYNLLVYSTTSGSFAARQPHLRTVLAGLNPDLLIVQEMNNAAARDSFLVNVLGNTQPGMWTGSSWFDVGTGEGMAVFWKPSLVSVSYISAIATITDSRKVLQCLVKPVGYLNKAGWFRLYSLHLKAGDTADDIARRESECAAIRSNILNTDQPLVGPNFLIGGDSNLYGATEGAYLRLTESQADNDGRCKDPLLMPGTWHLNSGYMLWDTQSPCNTGCVGSGGGMDDRFDLLLSAYTIQDGAGLDLLSGSNGYDSGNVGYITYGNDGRHFNQAIYPDNRAVGDVIGAALYAASDHIPVMAVLQLPAKLSTASQLAFGTVITGATAEQSLAISNIAPVPGDTLEYGFTAPAGFTAPSGTLLQAAGATATNQTIGMSTSTVGVKTGTLTIATNDPDTLTKNVLLSGTVLRHAAASLESLAVVLADTLDFGDHATDSFTDLAVKIFNQAYDASQARLSVNAGVISGGNGHFSIVGGFSGGLVGASPAEYVIRFDTTDVTLDSTYYATLTFSSTDEELPGATAQPDLVVTLRAHPMTSGAGVPGDLPTALRFYPPGPNPSTGAVRLAFDLPKAAPVQLAVFDLSGRRVATLADGTWEAGHHELRWDPLHGGHGLPGGLYFARFSAPGLTRTARLVLVR